MTKIIYLDYIALIMYVIMFVTYFTRMKKASLRRGVFSLLLTVSTLATLYDICAVSLDNMGSGAVILKYIVHAGYLILRNLVTPIFAAYIITITDTWHHIKKKPLVYYLTYIPVLAVVILTLSSPFTHLVFYLDQNDTYTRGPLFFILYLSAVFYSFFCAGYAIKYYSVLRFDRFIPLFSIVPLQALAVGVQFAYPTILCEMAASALCLQLITIMIDRPEEKLDTATGLYKSDAFFEMALQASQVEKPYSLALVNITNLSSISSCISFSSINDLYRVISERLEAVSTDFKIKPDFYNLENGLFAISLFNKDIKNTSDYAHRISDALETDCRVGTFSISVLSNILVANIPADISTIEQVRFICNNFRNEKYTGKVLLASEIVNTKNYLITSNIDGILKNAIDNEEFEVYYQPIYSTVEKRFNSAEALIRLYTNDYGFIPPDLFIPLAEESGLIHEIGLIVLRKVCDFIASEQFKSLKLDYIEVNLSTVQCMDSKLTSKILDVLYRRGIQPSQINLEITETASGILQKNMTSNINKLRNNGFTFSLDDFGTGYSNMIRISSLPLNIVKLDRSFTNTAGNKNLKLLLNITVKMIKRLGLKIVVEGVETEEMLKEFTDLGCEYIQGYYFSRPLPKEDFVEFISKSL